MERARLRVLSALLLTCSSPVDAALTRDPFQPPSEPDCSFSQLSPESLRLLGVIGEGDAEKSGEKIGWVQSADGRRHRLTEGAPLLLFPHWRVVQIDRHSVLFEGLMEETDPRCPPITTVTLTLNDRSINGEE